MIAQKLGCGIVSEPFQLMGNVKKWKNTYKNIEYAKGFRQNPYIDLQEAAQQMIGKISCIVNKIIPELKNIKVVIKTTRGTPKTVSDFFIGALSEYGIINVPNTGKWLDVILNSQDQFEMSIYDNKQKEKLSTANIVLGIDLKQITQGMSYIRAQLFTLNATDINMYGKKTKLDAGSAIKNCSASGYLLSEKIQRIIRAKGTGICNKKRDSHLWESTARDAARIKAYSNLLNKIEIYIQGNDNYSNNRLEHSEKNLIIKGIVRKAKLVSETFDKKSCTATAIYETKENKILSLLPDSRSHYVEIKRPKKILEKNLNKSSNDSYSTGNAVSSNFKASKAYSESQKIMIGNIQSKIQNLLSKDNIRHEVINCISLSGSVDLPDCWIENHYQSSNLDAPLRNYCTLPYDIKLHIQQKTMLITNGRIQGMGSSRSAAWEDALKGLAEKIYPLINDIALIINDNYSMTRTHQILKNLDEQLWQIENDISIESIIDDLNVVQKQIYVF